MANPFFDTPRSRRLRKDLVEMKALAKESSILTFEAKGDAPENYLLHFDGLGLEVGKDGEQIRRGHEVQVNLPLTYPMSMPQIRWITPVSHPNISSGSPCFGTFVMSPHVRLVEIVEIIWDMGRLASYNPYGGYGPLDIWQVRRKEFDFPVDKRILRDKAPVVEKPEPRGEGEFDLIMEGRGHHGGDLGDAGLDYEDIRTAIQKYLKENELDRDSRIYTQEEWLDRGEKYGNGALLTITTEGPLYQLLNDGSWRGAQAEIKAFNKFLEDLGLWWELGYAWSVHLYPVEA